MRKLITSIAVGALVGNLPIHAAEPAKAPLPLKTQTPVAAPVAAKAQTPVAAPVAAKAQTPVPKAQTPVPKAQTAATKDSKNASKASKPSAAYSGAPRRMMVPPPPPEIPLVTGGMSGSMEFSTLGMPIDLMGSADLEKVKTRLQTSLELLIKRADQRNSDLKEARDRVTQFEGLCTEGVVSKRDLNNARKELVLAESTDSDIDGRVADMKSDLARIDKRLKTLNGKKKTSGTKKPTK